MAVHPTDGLLLRNEAGAVVNGGENVSQAVLNLLSIRPTRVSTAGAQKRKPREARHGDGKVVANGTTVLLFRAQILQPLENGASLESEVLLHDGISVAHDGSSGRPKTEFICLGRGLVVAFGRERDRSDRTPDHTTEHPNHPKHC